MSGAWWTMHARDTSESIICLMFARSMFVSPRLYSAVYTTLPVENITVRIFTEIAFDVCMIQVFVVVWFR